MRLSGLLLIVASAALVSARELRGGAGVRSEVALLEVESATDEAAVQGSSAAPNATAPNATAPNATASEATDGGKKAPSVSKKQKEGMAKAKMQAYMRKIKLFQRLKKQRWDPIVEEKLASDLVSLDDIMQVTPEEKEIETKLRTKMNGYGVEISLNRRSQDRSTERRKKRGKRRSARRSAFIQKSRKRAMAREGIRMKKILARYQTLGVPKELQNKHTKAAMEYKAAVEKEHSKKKTKHFKKFAKEYGIGGKTPGTGNAPGARNAQGAELGEDANKHTKDYIMVMPVQKVQDALGQLEEDTSAAEASQADKLDDSLSDAALRKIHDSDTMVGAKP